MNTNQSGPVSAFSIYSQKSKRKRRSNDSNAKKITELQESSIKFNKSKKSKKVDDNEPSDKNHTDTGLIIDYNVDETIVTKSFVPEKSKSVNIVNSNQFCGKVNKKSAKKKNFSILRNETISNPKNKIISNNRTAEFTSTHFLNYKAVNNNEKVNKNIPRKLKKKSRNLENTRNILMKSRNNSTSEEDSDNIEEYQSSDEELDDSPNVTLNPKEEQSDGEDDLIDEESDKKKTQAQYLGREISEISENLNVSSVQVATGLFEWLIKPITVPKFMKMYWETTPLLVKRNVRNYYSALLSTPEIDSILRNNNILFGKHLDVTSYSDGVRETHNQTGRAQPHVVWDYYSNGCSVRLLNPQAFVKKILALNSTLQEYFGCFVGSNVYLTPPGSQGFAPHYDDIEAFVLQIEGKKQWKVYRPSKYDYLARFSSPNFRQEEIGEPMLDIILEAGDMLYFPRGFIHQGCTVPGEHSLHITLSVYQRTAWVDLLEKVLPMALKKAAHENVAYRRGLPIGYLKSLGLNNNYSPIKKGKKEFIKKAKDLVAKLADHLDDLDTAVDQMGIQFMHDALPPVLTPDETKRSVFGDGLHMKANGVLTEHKVLPLTANIKLLRANVCRLIEEEGEIRLYYTVDNSLEYHAEEPQYLLLSAETMYLVQFLIHKYPEFVAINKIPYPNDDEDEKYQAVCDLWDRGLLLTDMPLEQMKEEEKDI